MEATEESAGTVNDGKKFRQSGIENTIRLPITVTILLVSSLFSLQIFSYSSPTGSIEGFVINRN